MLDIATGGGHVAFAFAPHVADVIATDLTADMLRVTAEGAASRGLDNITTQSAAAADLPFPDHSFDLVTCRIAPHHFPDTYQFLRESERVLKRGGVFAMVDNSVPDGDAGDYINAFEKLRDPSHHRCLSIEAWEQDIYAAGLTLTHKESFWSAMNFHKWAARMNVSAVNVTRLQAMLIQAPRESAAVLTPQIEGSTITFHLQKTIFIATASH